MERENDSTIEKLKELSNKINEVINLRNEYERNFRKLQESLPVNIKLCKPCINKYRITYLQEGEYYMCYNCYPDSLS